MGLFSILSNSRRPDNSFIVIDIGGFNVKCLIIKNNSTANEIHVIGHGKSELTPGDVRAGQIINILPVAEKVDEAIEQAVLQSGIRPDTAIAGLSGLHLINQTTKIVYQRKNPDTKISSKELSQILHDSQQQLKQEIVNQQSDQEIELINASVVESYVDQVFVKNPLEFQGKSISMLLYSSFAPVIQLNALQSVADNIKLNLVATVNQSFALSKIFYRPNDHAHQGYILVDIGEDITNIVFVHESKIIDSITFEDGAATFTDVLSKNLEVSLIKANQYKIDYSRDLLTADTTEQIDNLLSVKMEKFCHKISAKINKFLRNYKLEHIYLCGGGANMRNLSSILSADINQELNQPINVQIIYPQQIEEVVDHSTTLTETDFLPAIAVAKIGLQFNDFDSTINNFFKKIFQTLRN
ncbi:MAG TPA: pilus assembly protein PilM [bacterium]|nr:pilus assembly protein PilM [bacterium]